MRSRLIIQSVNEGVWEKYLYAQRPFHEAYAERCDADYLAFVGWKDPTVSPAWNRLPMFLDAFDQGYERVLWLDADTLVVNQQVDIFDAVPNDRPWSMALAHGFPWPVIEDAYNDGVWLATSEPASRRGIQWAWDRRSDQLRPHHAPSMWELNWVLDYIVKHRNIVETMEDRFNWMPKEDFPPREEAVILAWHGRGHEERWPLFNAEVTKLKASL